MIRIKISSVVAASANMLWNGIGRPGESFLKREFFQHYGFTSRPLSGAEGIALKSGNTVIMIATEDRRYRLAIENGEVAIYTHEGSKVHLKNDGEIIITATTKVTVNAPEVNLGGTTGKSGVVNRQSVCAFTGGPHPDASSVCHAVKI